MEIVVALAMLAIFIWIVVAARKVGRQRQPRFTALAEQTRADIEQTLASGRLPSLDDSRIALRRGEVAHLQLEAELMKEVVDREYRGGHRA